MGARIKPVSVELVERSLAGMPPTQRKALTEGVARQLDVWAARVPAMPLTFTAALFGPFCSNGSGSGNGSGAVGSGSSSGSGSENGNDNGDVGGGAASNSSDTANGGGGGDPEVPTLLAAAASDNVQMLPIIAAIVGDEKANDAAYKLCGAVQSNMANGTAGSVWGSRVDSALASAAVAAKKTAAATAVAMKQAAVATASAAQEAAVAFQGAKVKMSSVFASAKDATSGLVAKLPPGWLRG